MQTKIAVPAVLAVVVAITAGGVYARGDTPTLGMYVSQNPATPMAIEWLVPHTPYEVFSQAAAQFDQELREKSGGSLSLKRTVTLQDVGLSEDVHSGMIFLDRGGPKVIAEYVDHLAKFDSRFEGLKLPYLFDNYDDALAFLDGPKAKKLLDAVTENTEYHALAFTMSGGLQIIVSKDKKIEKPEDLKGMKMLGISENTVNKKTLEAWGATLTRDQSFETTPDVEVLKGADAAEITYTRIGALLDTAPWFPKYVTETYHRLSLTILMVSDDFYNSLSAQDQRALEEAAHDAAVQEKLESIAIADLMRQKLIENGSIITPLTKEQRDAFKAAVAPMRREFDPKYPLVINAVTR